MTNESTLNSDQSGASKQEDSQSGFEAFLSDKRQKREEYLKGPLSQLAKLTAERERTDQAIREVKTAIRQIEDSMMTKPERWDRDLRLAVDELRKAPNRTMPMKALKDLIQTEFEIDDLLKPSIDAKKIAKAGPGRVKLPEEK